MKRLALTASLITLLLAISCTRADLSPGVRIYRPVTITTKTELPLSESAAALVISLTTTATDLNDIAYDSQSATTPLSAKITHSVGTGISYRWFLNGAVLANKTEATLTLPILQAGSYELAAEVGTGKHKYLQVLNFRIR